MGPRHPCSSLSLVSSAIPVALITQRWCTDATTPTALLLGPSDPQVIGHNCQTFCVALCDDLGSRRLPWHVSRLARCCRCLLGSEGRQVAAIRATRVVPSIGAGNGEPLLPATTSGTAPVTLVSNSPILSSTRANQRGVKVEI